MKNIILLFFLITSFFDGLSQNYNKYIEAYNYFSENTSFQKIYVHTDKNNYSIGESIWFKIYLFDSKKSQLDSIKQIITIELIDEEGNKSIVKKYISINGICFGKIDISENLLHGNYTVRSYTEKMKELNDDYLFEKEIFIESPNKEYTYNYQQTNRYNKKKRKKISYHSNFEQNNIIPDIKNSFYFLTLNNLNESIISKIEVVEGRNIICKTKSNKKGFSKISFIPKQNVDYKIKITSENKRTKKIKIKKTQSKGLLMDIISDDNIFFIELRNNYKSTKDTASRIFDLIFEKEGKIYLTKKINLLENTKVSVDKNLLPKGIIRIIVLDFKKQIVNQRIIYNPPKQKLLNVTTHRTNDTLTVKIITEQNSNISLSLTKDTSVSHSISEYIYYYSDIPNQFQILFSINKPETLNIIKEFKYNLNYDTLTYTEQGKLSSEKGVEISGYINNILEKVPAKNATVELTILNSYNDVFTTKTDANGNFVFKNLNYKDSIEFLIEARTEKGKKHVIINVNMPDSISKKNINFKNDKFRYKTKTVKKYKTSNSSLHSHADQVVFFDRINTAGYNNILDVLKGRVAGFTGNGESSNLRGFSSITQSNEPLYLIDDVPVSVETINSMNVEDVERVEIIKNASYASIYGNRSANGIIAVYTKKGYNINWGEYYGKIVGISKNEYFIKSSKKTKLETIYWYPNIETSEDETIIKIPLNKSIKNVVLNIQGVDNSETPLSANIQIE